MAQDNQVILSIKLDDGEAEKRLQRLVLDIEQTRLAQVQLTKARKANQVTDAEYAQQTVKLANQLTLQRAEQNSLTKSVDQFRTATTAGTGSVNAMRAQLALTTKQVNALSEAERKSEAGQALTQQVKALSDALKEAEQANGDFRRNVGNYPKGESLAPLVQQLVKLEEAMKSGTLTTEQAAAADREAIGYKQRIAQAGAAEGKSYEETTALVKNYSAAIRPATAELVKLEAEQRQVAESGKATGEQVSEIGFRFGKAQKQIQLATEALEEVPAAAADGVKETKGLGAGLLEAAKSSDVLGGAVEVLSSAKEKYTVAANLAKVATAGEVTVLGALKLALIATGLGLFVVVLGSVVAFLTKTQAGADFLSRKMAALGAVVQVVTNLAAEFGQKLVAAADNPKQAFTDLVEFIGNNLLNRLKAFGVIVDAIRNRDLTKLSDGFIQLGTGITDSTARVKALITQMGTAARAQEALTAESQKLLAAERALNVARDESRARIEGLKKLSDDSTKSVAIRTAAAKRAAQIENGLLAEQQRLQDAKISNLQATQALQKNLTNEDLDAMAELRRERATTQQESLTLQTELQNKINSLATESADKRIALRKEELDRQAQAIDRQLKTVQAGSDDELRLLQQKLQNSYQAELNVKDLTVKAKRAIDENYKSNQLAQEIDFNRKRVQLALQAQLDETAAELAVQQTGSAEALRLQAEQIEQQRSLALAGLAANADNTAAAAKINAAAASQQRNLEYADTVRQLNDYLENKRTLAERDYAQGLIQEREYQRQLAVVAKAGTDALTVINADYQQDNTANRKQAEANEIEAARQHTADVKRTEEVKQEIRETTVQSFKQGTEAVIGLFGEEAAASEAALVFRKVAALAEIAINLQKTLSLNTLAAAELGAIPLVGPALGAAYLATHNALAIAQAAVGAATVLSLEHGGLARVDGGHVAQGPSHRNGGIPLYYRGRPAGIEIEGNEPVLTAGVSRNPLLLSLASTVNQLAGGRPLVTNFPVPHMALGGLSQVQAFNQLRGPAGPAIDYDRLAQATAKALRQSPPVNRWSDFKAAEQRANDTARLSSF